MNEFELNLRLKQELESLAPNRLEELLAACEERDVVQPNIVTPMRRRPGRITRLIAAAAAVLLITAGTFFGVKDAQRSVVMLDVNPSVSITVNGLNRVKSVSLNSAEARTILDAKRYSGMSLADAVESMAAEMVSSNYLSPTANGVLISVKDAGDRRAEKLGAVVSEAIAEVTETASFQPAVLVQKVDGQASGRGALTQAIAARSAGIPLNAAENLSIHELLYVVASQKIDLGDAEMEGTLLNFVCASAEDAERIAAESVSALPEELSFRTVLSTYENELAYCVSFLHNGFWKECWVSAVSGEILNSPAPVWDPGEEDHVLASPAAPVTPSQPYVPDPVPTEPVNPPDSKWDVHDFFNFIDDLF